MSGSDLTAEEREQGTVFEPRFDAAGLICAVVQDAATGEIVMVAWMNREALDLTLASGTAHFYSRSRASLWKKGETSGNTLAVCEVRVDCDQDALILLVEPTGPACHTGARSCFYRVLESGALRRVQD
ncbi:phosphoribosyl-AMP cyclohydrolase [Parerythrobacter lacustris]|uniref:Phosphoribosyl-AMP cyclohydrolase n=1 Tax=Parerythrobacter lacustris TaxID=2969984 RepID=A0ABT1XQG4_9SPHN|nr:phosphoribosyl-AMP cyclohydrolase [Parerythrobacter lacustris]MCR2833900.1 phosphoribosyl-AMP cyclohydrolase [Parerythrobacter lacustris]